MSLATTEMRSSAAACVGLLSVTRTSALTCRSSVAWRAAAAGVSRESYTLVAGVKNRDVWTAAHGKPGRVHARGPRKIAVGEARYARQPRLGFPKINPRRANMPAGNRSFRDGDAATLN